MDQFNYLVKPGIVPALDTDYRPAVLANRAFLEAVHASGDATPLVIGLERPDGSVSRYETQVFPAGHAEVNQNLFFVERIVKFLLWQRGGCKLYVGGSPEVAEHLQGLYAPDGGRAFDYDFMSKIYDRPFTVVACAVDEVPAEAEAEKTLSRNLDGNRIGFDLGASDLKVSAVVDGEVVFSTEIEWQPVEQTDPDYHRQRIREALALAASKMTGVDAVGGSSAGVYVDNRPMVASLYRGIPEEKFDEVHNLFLDIREDMGVPLEIVNDGEVTALAGSMSLEDNGVLGIAMGSSEATGYVTLNGNITNWLNELAFAPVDYSPNAPCDPWSTDNGVGALYFSQQCVFRLAPKVGIEISPVLTNAQKLKFVQNKLEAGETGTRQIWETMGVYLGYTIAHYAAFYEIKHVLILGRCTSGQGGELLRGGARRVLEAEFPELAAQIKIELPDEKSRRVGQSIAAACLPQIEG